MTNVWKTSRSGDAESGTDILQVNNTGVLNINYSEEDNDLSNVEVHYFQRRHRFHLLIFEFVFALCLKCRYCCNGAYIRPVARYGLPAPPPGEFCRPWFSWSLMSCEFFCNMLALWQWKRYWVTAHYICYLSKDINLTLKEQKLEFM